VSRFIPALVVTGLGLATLITCSAGPRQETPLSAPQTPDLESADAIVRRCFEQSQGFDGLEAYELIGFPVEFAFSVARRWEADHRSVQMFIRVDRPERLAKVTFLWMRHASGSESAHWNPGPLANPGNRPRRIVSAPALAQAAPQGVPLDTLRPLFPEDLVHRRLPDTEVAGEPCYAIESRPAAGRELGFERATLWISKRTGVALRTVYLQGEAELRRNLVDPADVRFVGDRFLPMRRRIWTQSGATFELRLKNVLTDVPLPDRLFSQQNLRAGRFPAF
jgi:hypothetical protein